MTPVIKILDIRNSLENIRSQTPCKQIFTAKLILDWGVYPLQITPVISIPSSSGSVIVWLIRANICLNQVANYNGSHLYMYLIESIRCGYIILCTRGITIWYMSFDIDTTEYARYKHTVWWWGCMLISSVFLYRKAPTMMWLLQPTFPYLPWHGTFFELI